MSESSNKVPEVTLTFWIIKIAATTLGETGGDTVTMTLNWGYLAGTALFLAALVLLVSLQIVGEEVSSVSLLGDHHRLDDVRHDHGGFRRPLAGDRLRRRLLAAAGVFLATLGLWYRSSGSISVDTVSAPKVEMFYWAAITFSQTLGHRAR